MSTGFLIVPLNNRQNYRRKSKATPRTDLRILQKAMMERSAPARSIQHDLNEAGVDISLNTLRNRFKKKLLYV